MRTRQVGIWLYQNSGGNLIQEKIVRKLKEREINSVTGVDLSKAIVNNGDIYCKTDKNENLSLPSDIDLLFSYNAGETSSYQKYLYQAISKLIPTINNYDAYSLTEDKFQTSFLLKNFGVETAEYALCDKANSDYIEQIIEKWSKLVSKPLDGWGGSGLTKIDKKLLSYKNLLPIIDQQKLKKIYLEKFIDYDNTDYRIDIVNNQFVFCYGRRACKGSWKTNITSGGEVFLREPNDEIVNLALKATAITGLEIAGVDIIYDREKEKYIVLEVNGIPAFATPKQEEIGLKFNNKKIDLIVDLIDKRTKNSNYNKNIEAS